MNAYAQAFDVKTYENVERIPCVEITARVELTTKGPIESVDTMDIRRSVEVACMCHVHPAIKEGGAK